MEDYQIRLAELLSDVDRPYLVLDLRSLRDDVNEKIAEYDKAIVVTESARENSLTSKQLHSDALEGYEKKRTTLIDIRREVAAQIAALSKF